MAGHGVSDRPTVRGADRELAAMCRAYRLQAGVSLRDMADRTHRDASSLSRFERGQSVPRDLESLVAAYRALDTPVIAQQDRKPRRGPIAILFVSLVLAAGAATLEVGDSEAGLRVWIVAMSALLIALSVPRLLRVRSASETRKRRALRDVSLSLALAALGVGAIVRSYDTVTTILVAAAITTTLLSERYQ
jgi:transcriptional regulator with XRE-family HTH domain